MEGDPRPLLRGRFASPGPGGASYELTLSRRGLGARRLDGGGGGGGRDGGGRASLPLRHLLACRAGGGGELALTCYLPRGGKGAGGGPYRRMVKTFRVEEGQEEEGGGGGGGAATAERWATAVRCLLLGIELPEEPEAITPSLLPKPRRLLLLLNPCSGRSLAMRSCQNHVLPMLQEAGISYNLVCTEYRNHARKLVQEIRLSEWDAIVIISGDGLLYEVINGLMERPDWDRAIQMPVGILPAGSGNALAASINHNAGYPMVLGDDLLTNCTLLLCRGLVSPMDLVSVTTGSGLRHFSFLSVAWGFVADVDIESERFRAAGSARFSVGTLLCLASLRRYRGRLAYLPAPPSPSPPGPRAKPALRRSATGSAGQPAPAHPPLGRALSEDGLWRRPPPTPDTPGLPGEGFSFEEGEGGPGPDAVPLPGLPPGPPPPSRGPEPEPPPRDHLLPPLDQPVPGHWETLEGEFVLVLAVYQSHLGSDLVAAPAARFCEGRLHLCYVRAGITRRALLRLFLAMGRGAHFSLACPYLHCVPVLAFRLEPLGPAGIITIDGERVEAGPLQAQVHGGMARLVTGVPQGEGGGL